MNVEIVEGRPGGHLQIFVFGSIHEVGTVCTVPSSLNLITVYIIKLFVATLFPTERAWSVFKKTAQDFSMHKMRFSRLSLPNDILLVVRQGNPKDNQHISALKLNEDLKNWEAH